MPRLASNLLPIRRFAKQTKRASQDFMFSQRPFFAQYDRDLPISIANSRCSISIQHKFVYFRVPKAANSTIVASLAFAEDGTLPDSRSTKLLKTKRYLRPNKLSAIQTQEAEKFFKFGFVRHPIDRAISAYLDKLTSDTGIKNDVAAFLNKLPKETISFDEFLDFLQCGNGINSDPHFSLQSDLIFIPIEKLDFLGRFETLQNDLETVLSILFGTKKIVSVMHHSTQNKRKHFTINST